MKNIVKNLMVMVFILSLALAKSQAQQSPIGFSVEINGNSKKIEVVPGVWELWGKAYDVQNRLVGNAFILTTDNELLDKIEEAQKKGETIIMNGPQLDAVLSRMCLREYEKKRKAIEEKLRQEIVDAKANLKKSKGANKKTAKADLIKKQNQLLKEEADSPVFMEELLTGLSERMQKYCVYVHNVASVQINVSNPSGSREKNLRGG